MENLLDENDWERKFELQSLLSDITNELKLYDQISIVFLSSKVPEVALNVIDSLLNTKNVSSRNNKFFFWLRDLEVFKRDDWKNKLAELLAIVQNYRLIKLLGLSKSEAQEKYLPKNNYKSVSVSSIKKVLYNLFESLTSDKVMKFVNDVDQEYNIDHTNENKDGLEYLEYKFLLWHRDKIINLNSDENIHLDPLLPFLKSLGVDGFITDIKLMTEKVNGQLLRDKMHGKPEPSSKSFYPIQDVDNLGFCVIINQKNFSNSVFTKRWGTERDVERLIEVFTPFGFDVRVHSDLTYKELIETLDYYTRAIKEIHSVFVLIILSHGSENVIYTSDSQAVDMNTIEMVFQAELCPNLIGKPKIFIVQSCQGQKWQKLCARGEDTEIQCDGVEMIRHSIDENRGPQRGDSMIAWSTVQGFASFRDRHNGSWYIQELCKELWMFGSVCDLVEIFTRVNNNLRSKLYGDQFMVPSLLLSLRAKIKFPHQEKNIEEGKRQMLQRLIFEKVFEKFMEKNMSIKLLNLLNEYKY